MINVELDYTIYWGLRSLPFDNGIGRPINALCDQCLFAGAMKDAVQVDDRLVRRIGASQMMDVRICYEDVLEV